MKVPLFDDLSDEEFQQVWPAEIAMAVRDGELLVAYLLPALSVVRKRYKQIVKPPPPPRMPQGRRSVLNYLQARIVARLPKSMTVRETAELFGVGKQVISNIRRGWRPRIDSSTLAATRSPKRSAS
jgi:hypothetical protein